jgi:hypothetical protein
LRLTTLKAANITATIPTTTYTIPAMINLYFLSKTNPHIQNLDCVNNNTTTFVKVRLLEEIFSVIWWRFYLAVVAGIFHSYPVYWMIDGIIIQLIITGNYIDG